MEGWIKLYRAISSHSIWTSEPFTRGQAWVDLLLLASRKANFFRRNGMRIDIKRGEIGITERGLADRWQWSRGKVSRFVNELKTDHQLKTRKVGSYQIISIVNYDYYQSKRATDDTTDRATDEPPTDTIKKEEKDKEVNNKEKNKEKRKVFIKPTLDEIKEYCQVRNNGINPDHFFNFYESKGWMVGSNKMKDWKACVRTWEQKNKSNETKQSNTNSKGTRQSALEQFALNRVKGK